MPPANDLIISPNHKGTLLSRLNPAEQARFDQLEAIVYGGKDTAIAVAQALVTIRDGIQVTHNTTEALEAIQREDLYRSCGFNDPDEYRLRRFGISKSQFSLLKSAKRFHTLLLEANKGRSEPLPEPESLYISRPLNPLSDEEKLAVWEEANNEAQQQGIPVSNSIVSAKAKRFKSAKTAEKKNRRSKQSRS